MISHGDNCRRCGGKMSALKPVADGPHKGQMRNFCTRCGHAVFHAPEVPVPPSRAQDIFGPPRN